MRKFFLFFYFYFAILYVKSDFTVHTYNGAKQLSAYSNGVPSSFFDYNGKNSFSCQVPDVFHEKPTALQNKFEFKNNDQVNSYKINIKQIIVDRNVANPSIFGNFPQDIYPAGALTINLAYNCLNLSESELFFTPIGITFEILNPLNLQVIEKMELSYIKVCEYRDDLDYKFDYSLVIVAIMVALFALSGLKISKMMSMKKKNVTVNINFMKCFIYFIVLIPLILLLNYVHKIFLIVYKVIISIVAFLGFVFIFNQILSNLLMRSNFFRVIFTIPKLGLQITLFMIIGAIFALALIISWGVTDNWILSDIITLALFVAAISIFKVSKFKNCLILMIIQILADILWMVLFNYIFNKNYEENQQYIDDKQYNDYFGSKLTLPMKIECVYIKPQYNLNSKCSWISVSNLIIPSLVISFFNRYDYYVNSYIYSFVSIVSYFLGIIIWVSVQSNITKIIPLSIYCYSIICILCGMLSIKRNEHYEIWNGLFPDLGLDELMMKSHDLMFEPTEKDKEKDPSETIKKNEKDDYKNYETEIIKDGKSVSISVRHSESLI